MSTKVISNYPVKFCPLCSAGLENANAAGRRRLVCSECGWIHYLNPVPAAASLVVDYKKRVLLVKRAIAPNRGSWALPAGFIEIDESPAEAALRELKEETSLEGEVEHLIGVYPQPSGNYGSVLTVGYRIKTSPGARPEAGDDALQAEFREIPDFDIIPFISHRRMLEKELGHKK